MSPDVRPIGQSSPLPPPQEVRMTASYSPPLPLRHPLQENLDAFAVGGIQVQVVPARGIAPDVPEHPGPELRRTVEVGAVDHDHELAPQVWCAASHPAEPPATS